MFGRPRCREWTPLATQQLRLRSLIQIVGYNIRPPEWCRSQCSYYLTLHHTTMSAPFYTSERISSPHPKWKEIDSELTQRMSSTNVVIRIWCHLMHPTEENVQDTVIQTWGVYLSGLRYIGANLASNFNSDCFKSNTLVFQLHGGYFCSYKSLKLDIIPPENEMEHGSLSSDSSGRTNLSKIILDGKHLGHKSIKESRSISPSKFSKRFDKEYSKSHSPVERNFHQNFPTIRNSASLNIQRDRYRDDSSEVKNSNHIYEHSPDKLDVKEFTTSDENCDSLSKNASHEELSASKVDLSETAENYDLRNESDGVPKYRYLAMNFLKSEIRPSYNATKLQKLHLLQYSIKKRQEAVQEIKERIYKNSALAEHGAQIDDQCVSNLKLRTRSQRSLFSPDNENLVKEKSSSQSDLSVKNGKVKEDRPISNGPRLTLKLNDLLSFKAKPSPFQRSEHIRLTKQLEILRFKRIILSDERDSKLANIRRLKEKHSKLYEENQDVGTELMQGYHALSRRNDAGREAAAARDLAARAHAALQDARARLLAHLHHVFFIEQKDTSTWTICNVPLPVCGDDSPRASNLLSDSVAAGLVAQATCLAAGILSQPLRYKITLLGSASKILDVTPDLPDPNIPLFARAGDITLFRYAMFLLNKCIAQLAVGRGLPVADIRPTLANLQRLLTAPTHLSDTSKLFGTYRWLSDGQCGRTQSLRSLVASERGKFRQFNRFKDAVDGQSPQSAMNLRLHRQSRSVGSYQDDQEMPNHDASTTSIMGSESNIYNMKLAQNSNDTQTELKTHNSDSEISRIVEQYDETEQKVIFTLGDDTTLIGLESKLVRLSTNNGDEITCSTCLDENVKRICSEIKEYCSSSKELCSEEFCSTNNCSTNESSTNNCSSGYINSDFYSNKDIHEGFDVARHLDIAMYMGKRASEIEEADVCSNCESNKDGVCDLACAKNVRDVIVIPSAEAVLDTGQATEVDEVGDK